MNPVEFLPNNNGFICLHKYSLSPLFSVRQTSRSLLAALILTSGLASCGSKTKDTELVATTTSVSPTETPPAQAAAPAPSPTAAATNAAPAASFDINTVPVTNAELGGFPYFSPLKGYSVNTSNSEDYDFERTYVHDGKNLIPVEGKVSQHLIDLDNGQKKASELMIQRNYEDLLKQLGATKVHSGKVAQDAIDRVGQDESYKHGKWVISTDHVTDTYVIRQKNKEVWVQVTPLGSDGNYALNVTERAAMPQQVTTLKAEEVKAN